MPPIKRYSDMSEEIQNVKIWCLSHKVMTYKGVPPIPWRHNPALM